MTTPSLAWRIEEACANAWPPLKQVLLGDWALRFSEGLTRRVNSANPLRERAGGLEAVFPLICALYKAQRQAAIVRVPSFLGEGPDRYLADEGFSAEAETLALYGGLPDRTGAPDPEVSLAAGPSVAWLAAKAELNGFDPREALTYRKLVAGILLPSVFAGMAVNGSYRSLAYGVIHDGLLSLDSVVTAKAHRGRGYSRRTLTAILSWARAQGAKEVCLQVEGENAPAIGLYRGLGLTQEVYRYHYRRKPLAGDAIVP